MAVTLQFVDKIDASPTVRLDLNAGVWSPMLEGTDFGFPELERAVVSTLLQDGARIPASAYGLRTLTLRLLIDASTADAAATAEQNLYRELNRANNILKFQPSTTAPVFFRTFRCSPSSVQVITEGAKKYVTVPIMAEPFAYGLKVTLGPYTVNQDPANATNPTYVDIPAASVTGDVETPALIRFTDYLAVSEMSLTAIRRRGTPSSAITLRQAEALTAGTDTSVQANDAAFSGAGSNYMRCTFATATKVTRLSGLFPGDTAAQPIDHRGTYRCYARVRASTSTASTFTAQLSWAVNTQLFGDTTTFSTSSTNFRLIDLGLVSFPSGNDPVYDGYTNTELKAEQSTIRMLAGRTSGTASLDIDYLQFIPADEELCTVKWASDAGRPVLDGPNDTVYSYESTGGLDYVQTGDPSARVGCIPQLAPNQVNRLFFVRKVDTAWSHLIADTAVFEVRFWPRYLHVRPSAS